MTKWRPRDIAAAGMTAALYFTLTMLTAQFGFLGAQVRVSEALTLLPVLTPAAIPGLFVGCFLSNLLLGGVSVLDMIFGPLATLAAALLTRKLRAHLLLAALPPVAINAVVVGLILFIQFGGSFWLLAGSVALGQTIACYGLGLAILWAFRRLPFIR